MNGLSSSIWIIIIICFSHLNLFLCGSLNDEGIGLLKFKEKVIKDPFGVLSSWKDDTKFCSWFGIECVGGHVLSLDLRNSCLEGTLAPEIRYLQHIRSIILRNNSFSGEIPEEIRDLKELKLLDLAYNNVTRPESGHSIPILLLDNNGLPLDIYPEYEEHIMRSDDPVDENCALRSLPCTRHNGWQKDAVPMRMLQQGDIRKNASPPPNRAANILPTPPTEGLQAGPPPPSPTLKAPATSQEPPLPKSKGSESILTRPSPKQNASLPIHAPPPEVISPPPAVPSPVATKENSVGIVVGVVSAGFVGLVLVIVGGMYLWRSKKIIIVRAGLTGQLQRAFVTGIPNLKRSELETACEDFSNVIGSSSIGTLYKGILSSGTEIAVISFPVKYAKDWSQHLEMQFRKKIEALTTVKHKNFVNLVGYCEEDNPFTRMMVFEYSPNGTLFEHLHVKEAEHLDWRIRMRVAMGMAYCLEHMHQLVPPITHPNFNSSSVNLSEDYASKISDFSLWNQLVASQMKPTNLEPSSTTPESNVYSFGLVLLEMITGRATLSLENISLEEWTVEYLKGERPVEEWVDPMLRSFKHGQLEKIGEVISKCLQVDPQKRPTMGDISTRLKEITGIDRDKAAPRFSPVWWEELEVISVSSR